MSNSKLSLFVMFAFIIRLPNADYINCDQIQTIEIYKNKIVARLTGHNNKVTLLNHSDKSTQDQFIYDFVDRCNSGVIDYE